MGNRQTSMGSFRSFFNLYACCRTSLCTTAVHERYIVRTLLQFGRERELTSDYRTVSDGLHSSLPQLTKDKWPLHQHVYKMALLSRSQLQKSCSRILPLLLLSPFFVFCYPPMSYLLYPFVLSTRNPRT